MNAQGPIFNDLSNEQKREWQRVSNLLLEAGRVTKPEYPEISSVRRNPNDSLAKAIDHTLLKQTAEEADFNKVYKEAAAWETWSVCVPSNRVRQASVSLQNSGVQVCTVVGFPFGYESTRAKVCDTKQAIIEGASEIDMVLPVGLLRDGDVLSVFDDVRGVVDAALEQGRSSGISVLVKVILESSELSPIQLVTGGTIACFAGAHFLKTSTGFASGGATLEALHVMRLIAGEHRGVKASGGIRTREFALQCLSLGVDRIGASSTGTLISTDPPTAQSNDGY